MRQSLRPLSTRPGGPVCRIRRGETGDMGLCSRRDGHGWLYELSNYPTLGPLCLLHFGLGGGGGQAILERRSYDVTKKG